MAETARCGLLVWDTQGARVLDVMGLCAFKSYSRNVLGTSHAHCMYFISCEHAMEGIHVSVRYVCFIKYEEQQQD